MNEWLALSGAPLTLAQIDEGTAGQTTGMTEPAKPAPSEGGEASPWRFFAFSLAAFLIIIILAVASTRRMRLVPRGLQNLLEMAVESLYGIPEMVMGPRGRTYAPFICTFFLYILVMNLLGLVPLARSGTASLSITFGMGIFAFLMVQYYGFKVHGVRYFLHFAGPVWWLAWLIFPLELVSEIIRPISLSVRLYGNIFGEEQVIAALAQNLHPLAAVLMLPLQLLTSVLQAFVFSLLVTVYLSMATEKHEEAH